MGRFKVPWQQRVERFAVVTFCHSINDGGDVGLWIEAGQLGAFD